MRIATLVLTAAGIAAAMSMSAALAGKDEIKPFVHLPKTWDAGVDEAKKLVLPIVVHSHGWN
jgi:hypothetical protein